MSTPFAVFGPGILIAQRTDITTPSPINVGYVQEFSIENAATNKKLYGQKKYPLVAAQGTINTTGKFKAATFSGLAWNALMYGESSFTSGSINWNIDSTYSVPGTTAYTVSVGSSTTFEADLGVKYSTSGLPFQRVAGGSETTGAYSVSGNVYSFAAGDASAAIKVTYTNTISTGQTMIVTNQQIGNTATFQLDYYTALDQPTAKQFAVRVFNGVCSKHALGFKLEDFTIPEFEFDIFANSSDQVYKFYFPEVS